MGRAPCCDKASVKKGPWSPEEDAKLKAYIEQHGTGGNWIALPQKIGLKRCGKSCRLRWLNYLRPNIKHGGFSEEEDNIICSLYINIGSRWSIIAAQLPGRTDNDIKNYWNTKLKKKLLGKQRKADQAARRAAAAAKQEPNKTLNDNTSYIHGAAPNQMTLYWPDLTSVLGPPLPSLSYQDQESLRNMLVKLGGRFSDDQQPTSPNLQYPFDNFTSFDQNQAQDGSIDMIPPSSQPICPLHPTICPGFFQGLDNFPAEFSDQELIFGNNQEQYDAFNGFYGSEIVDGSSGISSSVESSSNNWGDISSLGNYNNNHNYPPQVIHVSPAAGGFEAANNNSRSSNIIPQVSSFQDSSFSGPE